jgi:hypothetical protein
MYLHALFPPGDYATDKGGVIGGRSKRMFTQFIRKAVWIHRIGSVVLAAALLGCAGQQTSVDQPATSTTIPQAAVDQKPAATQPTAAVAAPADLYSSDLWTTNLVDLEGSAKRGNWPKAAALDDGFCTIKAGMSIEFNTDISPDDANSRTGSFDVWVSTVDISSKPQLHQSFDVLDANGKSLFKLGPFGGFEIPSAVNYHHWIGYFTYPKDADPQIAKCYRLPSTCKQ